MLYSIEVVFVNTEAHKNVKPYWFFCGIANALSLVALILVLAVALPAFGMWFYYWQYDANNTYAVVNMVPDDLHEVTRHMISYLRGDLDRDYGLQIETVVGGQTRYFFSDIEIRHMVDVYDLVVIGLTVRNIAIILFVVTLIAFALWGRNYIKCLLKSWQYVTASIFTLLASLVLVISINWHRAWHIFHEIFFDNDYWILDPRVDLLINIVPYPFFFSMSVFIGAFFAGGLIALFVISVVLQKKFLYTDSESF
jgi:integral membrane protein (TIGR01906 family)